MKPGSLGEESISIILRELLYGLEYLHGDNKLHRDIKGANFDDYPLPDKLTTMQLQTFFLVRADRLSLQILASLASFLRP
jgi:hypothetical protein